MRVPGDMAMTDTRANLSVQTQISLKALQRQIEALNAAAKSGAGVAATEIRVQLAAPDEQAHKAA